MQGRKTKEQAYQEKDYYWLFPYSGLGGEDMVMIKHF